MIVLIPLGGLGERFKTCGYKNPKPLINVLGKTIISWLIDNLNLENVRELIIPYNKNLEKYNFESVIKKKYIKKNIKLIKLNTQTRGAAETVLKGIEGIDYDDCPILCIDGDNFYRCDIISKWNGENSVFYFEDNSDSSAYSYLEITNNNNITNIIEKDKISSHASCGVYGFRSFRDLKKYCEHIIDHNIRDRNEYYISTVIKTMINDGHVFTAKYINNQDYTCLGTPMDVRLFCNNYPRISAMDNNISLLPQRYCFDLDNTLVSYPEIPGDYTTVKPIQSNIDFLKYLKSFGHTIIIYTARRMNTHNGNIGKVMTDIGKITLETLEKFNIPYDEIYFGKPYADYYIDDLAISPYDNLEKELGFYRSTVDTRSFNSINTGIIATYKKSGKDLSGEIYWYTHIPNEIKDMFPLVFDIDPNGKYYVMEKINGIPFSKLFVAEEMTLEHLKHIMNSLNRLHHTLISSIKNNKNINIYQNYCQKIKSRYEQYDYSIFENSSSIYKKIYTKLRIYEEKNMGKISVIHGDAVLTNIMLNQFGKIKFIDMRGKQGNQLTVLGDEFYDWAKLYQSLIGYDEILENTYVSFNYKNSLLKYFEDRFLEEYGNEQFEYLKYITASLLFSLIPLHDNEKCVNYYNLIYRCI